MKYTIIHEHEGDGCRSVTCDCDSEDVSRHSLVNCKCVRCGRAFEHKWPDLFAHRSGDTICCQRPNCQVTGRVSNVLQGSTRVATVSYQDEEAKLPEAGSCVVPEDAPLVYQYGCAPATRQKLAYVAPEIAVRDLRRAIHSHNRSEAHVAACSLAKSFRHLLPHFSGEDQAKVNALLAEMKMEIDLDPPSHAHTEPEIGKQ